MSIPWFYTWSEPVFHNILQDTLSDYDIRAIYTDGSTLKHRAELIVQALKDSTTPYIIFSVSDIIVKPDFSSELSEETVDMKFMDGPQGEPQVGVLYLKNTSDVQDFWNSLIISDTPLEEAIKGFKGTWSKFSDKSKTSDTWDKMSEFNILQLIPSGFGKEFDFAEKIFTMAQHIELQSYMQHVPEDVIPFIYKIQELLFLAHKEMKKTA